MKKFSRRNFLKVSAAAVPAAALGAVMLPDMAADRISTAALRQLLDSQVYASYPRGFKHTKVSQSVVTFGDDIVFDAWGKAVADEMRRMEREVAADVFNKAFSS